MSVKRFGVQPTVLTELHGVGDVLFDTIPVAEVLREHEMDGFVRAMTVRNSEGETPSILVLFLDSNLSIGTPGEAPVMNKTIIDRVTGIIAIPGADFTAIEGVAIATEQNLSIPLDSLDGSGTVYVACITTANPPTFTQPNSFNFCFWVEET